MRGIEELDLALMGYESVEDWAARPRLPIAWSRWIPTVSGTTRSGSSSPSAWVIARRCSMPTSSLGDALARAGAIDKAMAVFRRVQEHDPGQSTRRTRPRDAGVDEPRPRERRAAAAADRVSRPPGRRTRGA